MNRTFAALLLVVAAGAIAQQPPDPPPLPPAVGNAVLLATNSIQIDRDCVVTRGDLVVNNASTSPILGEKDLSIDQGVKTPAGFALKANSVDIDGGAVVDGDVHYNILQNNGTINGAVHTPLALPVIGTLPQLPPFQPAGTQNVTVPNGATQPLGADAYGDVVVGRDATLRIPGGPYVFASLTTERGASIIFDGPGEIVINGAMTLGANTTIGAAPPVTTKHKMIFVRGAVSIGKSNTISATILAPNGAIDAGDSLSLTGAFVARDIHIGHDSTLTLRSGFRNLPPSASDQTVSVGSTAVVITLTGSDPDNDPLHFSIGFPPINGTLSPVVQSGPTSATVIYTPNFPNPNDVFSFIVTDSEGFTAEGMVTINGGAEPPAPPTTIVAQPAVIDVPSNVPSNVPLVALGPPGVPITISIVEGSGPFHGTLGPLQQPSMDPPHPGSVVYVPQHDFAGEDLFFFRACGTISGEEVCDVARISLAVHGPESGELAPDQTVSADAGSPLPILLTVGDPPNAVYRIVTLPANGTLTDSNGAVITQAPYTLPSAVVTYTANPGFNGQDAFTFGVTAGTQSDTGTVTINVTAPDNGRG
jgi:hypothetical protein